MRQARFELAAACVQTNYHILLLLRSCSCRTACSLWLAADVFQSQPSGSTMLDLEETPLARSSLNTRIKPCQFCQIFLRKLDLLASLSGLVVLVRIPVLLVHLRPLFAVETSPSSQTSSKPLSESGIFYDLMLHILLL